ncbi:AAA family ATPase [Streptosporangium sp. NPDC051023]|uniref:AAA family ATPase n=1 Tax=Streptosporangium sp. NPDC051023 TaxID=3155410 RepID=UPI00344BBA64
MDRTLPFLRRMRLKNYKSIESCDVTFTPLLVLLGPNAAGKSNFLDALRFVKEALDTTPARALETRGGLNEVLRRVPEGADEFSVHLDLTVESDGDPIFAEYGFTIARDASGRRAFVVRREWCVFRDAEDESGFSKIRRQSRPLTSGFEVVAGLIVGAPDGRGGIERDRLFLPLAAIRDEFAELYAGLSDMLFYHVDVERMRQIEPRTQQADLGPSGQNLGSLLGILARDHPVFKARVDDYIRAIVPGAAGVEERVLDNYSTIELRARNGDQELAFGPDSMSEGTLRAAGLLAALFQPAVLEGETTLLGIEEPETSLHPAAAGALFDALSEASERVQTVVTTQSADLLDRDDFDPAFVRVVTMTDGLTTIGEIDDVSRRIVEDRRATVGELMRGGQLLPKAQPDVKLPPEGMK